MQRTRTRSLAVAAVATTGLLGVLATQVFGTAASARADATPVPVSDNAWCEQGIADAANLANGNILLGTLLDPTGATVGGYNPAADAAGRLGKSPAIYSYYVNWQTKPGGVIKDDGSYDQWGFLDTLADGVQQKGGILGLTLSLGQGLGPNHINAATAADLANHLKTYNTLEGVPVLLRIGPEMNGNWSVWDQQPEEFKAAFRVIADAVHQIAPATQTVWAPAFGAGYPWGFHGTADENAYKAKYGMTDYNDLDTSGDGHITIADDPYSPYWPGDQYVDWVGMSEYHFGDAYPWGPNTLPPPDEFEGELRGTYHPASQAMTTSDFYATYTGTAAGQHDKPLMIAETGAWYTPDTASLPGAQTEMAIKTAWWDSIVASLPRLPRLKALVFFDTTQNPGSVTDPTAFSPPLTTRIQWQYDRTPELISAFLQHFGDDSTYTYSLGHPCLPGGSTYPPPTTDPPTDPPTTQPTAQPTTDPPPSTVVPSVVPTSAAPTVAPPTPPAGRVVNRTVCTAVKKAALIHGRMKVTKVTTTCQVQQVRAVWTVGTVCSNVKTTSTVRGRKVTTTKRVCKQAPVQQITVLKVLEKTVTTKYVDARGRTVKP